MSPTALKKLLALLTFKPAPALAVAVPVIVSVPLESMVEAPVTKALLPVAVDPVMVMLPPPFVVMAMGEFWPRPTPVALLVATP